MEETALHIVMVGHVDHGKSTVIGRLLYSTNALPEGTIDKVKNIAKETGKPFEYAYLLDAFEEEQKQGITIDTTRLQFKTDKRDYVIIDAPGHQEFLKNMISGASNAEAAFLIVDAARGVEAQTKRHAYILKLLGIQKIYVLINKMDLVDYAQSRYEAVSQQVADFLNTLGVKPLGYLPISAYYGENLLNHSEKMPWYKGQNFIETLDGIQANETLDNRPFRLPIQDVFKFDNRRIIAGRLESGTLKVGDDVTIYPSGRQTTVAGFANWAPKDAKTQAIAGQSVGILLKDEFFNQRGEIITKTQEKEKPFVSTIVETNLFWMGEAPLVPGKTYKLKIATQQVMAKVLKIIKVTDAATLEAKENANKVQLNDVAEVVFQTEQPLVFDFFTNQHVTGRFVLVDGYDVAGGGTITEKYQGEVALDGAVFSDGSAAYQLNLFDTYTLTSGGRIETHEHTGRYRIQDPLPLESSGYHYPAQFKIILPRQNRVLSVDHGRFAGVSDLEHTANWQQTPVINSIGAKLKLTANGDIQAFLAEQETLNDKTKEAFYQKWLDFNAYHKVLIEDI